MVFGPALLCYLLFLGIYGFFGISAIYHLRQYSLPGWSGGRISIAIFILLSLFLIGLSLFAFFRIPWDALIPPNL